MQVIDEPNLIRVNLKLGTVNDVVLEDSKGKCVMFNRNFASTLKETSEFSFALVTIKEENLAFKHVQKKYEDMFLFDKSNKHSISTIRKECSDVDKVRKG